MQVITRQLKGINVINNTAANRVLMFLRRYRLQLSIGLIIVVMAGFVPYLVISNIDRPAKAPAATYDEPLWLRDLIVNSHMSDFYSVYECSDGSGRPEIPCPDYVATVKFRGKAKDTPPVFTPARNAKGEVVIDFKAKWEPATCFNASNGQRICLDDRWDVTIVFAPAGVVPFATNEYDSQYVGWHGFKLFGRKSWGDDRLLSPTSTGTFEVYAGDPDPDMKAKRLPADRIGI
jgi:hypothetical protein